MLQTITRKENIQFFLHDYYFGHGKWIAGLRLMGGPLLLLIGINQYKLSEDKASIAYGGFCFVYGIYMLLRPYLWVLFRLDSYKAERIEIRVNEGMLFIKDDKNQHEIGLGTFQKIIENKHYFTFIISRSQRIRMPKRLFNHEAQNMLKQGISTQ